MLSTFRKLCLFALIVGAASAQAFAAPINHGNFVGTSVLFQDVTEDSATDPTPLFGPPVVSGNGLLFTPLSAFSAQTSGGGADITDGKLTTVISGTGGNRISQIQLTEGGDYTLFGVGTAATQAAIGSPVFVTLLELNGNPVNPTQIYAGNLSFSPSGGTYNLVNDPGTGVPWTGNLTVDVDAALAILGIPAQATKVRLSLDNTLVATSETGSGSFIAKKDIPIKIDVTVPEPATWVLAGFAALGLGLARRR